MRYLSFVLNGRASYGVVQGKNIVDFGARIGEAQPDLRHFLEARALGFHAPSVPAGTADCRVDDIVYLPVCEPRKIVCVGLNYESHRKETGRRETQHPTLFSRYSDTLVGHRAPIVRPSVSTALDYEGELAVVIGRAAHRVPADRAMDVVAGYACFNDASIRDWQRHTSQYLPGKNFPATAPLGPELVTPDEVGPLGDQTIQTRLNGEVMQSAVLGDMIFPVAELIAYITSFTRLLPGDVIATGTPGGVGFTRDPPVYMKAGDTIEISIERVGHLKNDIVDE